MDGLARWDSLGDATDVSDVDLSLHFLFVHIVDGLIRDDEHALLRPVIHINFLHHGGIDKRLYDNAQTILERNLKRRTLSNQAHERPIVLKVDVVAHRRQIHICSC